MERPDAGMLLYEAKYLSTYPAASPTKHSGISLALDADRLVMIART